MLFDTRVSISSTPGCEHRLDGGVKRGKTGILAIKSKCFYEKGL